MKKIIILISLLSLVSICNAQEFKEEYLNLKVFQSYNAEDYSWCLAWDKDYKTYFILSTEFPEIAKYYNDLDFFHREIYYDDKDISNKYIFVGTYSYESRNGQRTVPAYMQKDTFYAYYKGYKNNLNSFRDLLKIWLDYCVIKEE
ncbi:MAG: hypothetical protein J6U29_01040 [Bacteroidales bacterium]|nr:hypothetical protein [Bacteroidales bacterium]